MHDRGAVVPVAVVSPRSEWGVRQALNLLKELNLYDSFTISVKSGGHGYFHRQPTPRPVILLNMGSMTNHSIANDILIAEPGCWLGQVIHALAKSGKAIPHGDCFDVGVGGHFTTAGWDLLLTRQYGLGCQSLIGGRVVLWDGSVVEVDQDNNPDLLHAMRGGAVAGAGIATQLRLQLFDEPVSVTWCTKSLSKEELDIFVSSGILSKSPNLPYQITASFNFHFELGKPDPVCAFRIASIVPTSETLASVRKHFGHEISSVLEDRSLWNEGALVDFRMKAATDFLAANPDMLGELSPAKMHENPLAVWRPTNAYNEMMRSYSMQTSYWVIPECDSVLHELYEFFDAAKTHPIHERMYSLVTLGAGKMTEMQDRCSMPVGDMLIRFETHWDDEEKYGMWCRQKVDVASRIIEARADPNIDRPFRGDISFREQGEDDKLRSILAKYDRR